MRRTLRTILNLGPSIVWALLILKLLLTQSSELPRFPILFSIPHFDKIVHSILFGIWMATLLWASVRHFQSTNGWKIALILVLVLGAGTELLQEFSVISREGSVLDLAADFGGALLALAILNRPIKAMIMEKSR
ncbi:MAG: VanZ family protein [Flavobacteriales bacterium]